MSTATISSFSMFAILALAISSAQAAQPAVGSRAFLNMQTGFYTEPRKDIFGRVLVTGGYSQPQTIGAGTITAIRSDGTIEFTMDADKKSNPPRGAIQFNIPTKEATNLLPRVDCDYSGQKVYSTQTYDAFYVNGYVRNQAGVGVAKEVFGSCTSGHATFDSPLLDSPRRVEVAAILKPNKTCDFLEKRGHSSQSIAVPHLNGWVNVEVGPGVVKEAYGECKTGKVIFKSNRSPEAPPLVLEASKITTVQSIEDIKMTAGTQAVR